MRRTEGSIALSPQSPPAHDGGTGATTHTPTGGPRILAAVRTSLSRKASELRAEKRGRETTADDGSKTPHGGACLPIAARDPCNERATAGRISARVDHERVPMAFDLYLWPKAGEPLDQDRIVEAISSEPAIREDARDPERFLYHREDTSVFLSVLLERGLAKAVRRRAAAARGEPIEEEEGGADEGAETSEDLGEPPLPEEPPVEFAPVTITVPFFVPSFFLREAIQFAARLSDAAGMEWDHAFSGEASGAREAGDREPPAPPSFETLFVQWREEMRKALAALARPVPLAVWSEAEAGLWWAYGEARSRLRAELEPEGVEVPVLQLARHEGRLKTVCAWDASRPTVLPRCDLILLTRVRFKKGVFLPRRVPEDGLVSGAKIWDMLGPFSEVRKEPVDLDLPRGPEAPRAGGRRVGDAPLPAPRNRAPRHPLRRGGLRPRRARGGKGGKRLRQEGRPQRIPKNG